METTAGLHVIGSFEHPEKPQSVTASDVRAMPHCTPRALNRGGLVLRFTHDERNNNKWFGENIDAN